MFKAVRQNAEAEGFCLRDRIDFGLAIDQHSWQFANLGDPPAVIFAIQDDRQAH